MARFDGPVQRARQSARVTEITSTAQEKCRFVNADTKVFLGLGKPPM
jgi:hypothetical protein